MQKLLLLAWLPLAVFLFPLPPQSAQQLATQIHGPQGTEQSSASSNKGDVKRQLTREELDMMTSALWVRWIQTLGLLALGVLVGVLAWGGYRHWKAFAFGMSLLYLALVAYRYVAVERAVPDSWLFFDTTNHFMRLVQANLRIVEVGISNGSVMRPAWVIYNEMLMPIFQVVVLAWLLWLVLRRKSERA